MNTAIAKPSKALKDSIAVVRSALDAVDRARQIYLAQIKRAEAEYFDRIRSATGAAGEDAAEAAPPEPQPAAQAQA